MPKSKGRSKPKQKQLDTPIPEPSPVTLRLIAVIERRYSETPEAQPCAACGNGRGIRKLEYTNSKGTHFLICEPCDAWLHTLDRDTRKRVMRRQIDQLELQLARLPFFRDWLTKGVRRGESMAA